MKEHPIYMSEEEIRAILEKKKTQKRILVKGNALKMLTICTPDVIVRDMPKYHIGDRLWVKETWAVGCRPNPNSGWVDGIEYKADLAYLDDIESMPLRVIDDQELYLYESEGWKSPITMPRWASRITIEITDIRIERLQDITNNDAKSEGVEPEVLSGHYYYLSGYHELWQDLNAKRGFSWESNPWVWVLTFKVV